MKEIVIFCLVIVLLFACMMGGAAAWSNADCSAKTENIGFAHKWGFFSGCMIEAQPEQWIPLENWRMFEE
jgi:hypothetical protein